MQATEDKQLKHQDKRQLFFTRQAPK